MVLELTEEEVLELIEEKKSFVLDVYMDNCTFCEQYLPIFYNVSGDKEFYKFKLPAQSAGGSKFKREYMKVNGKEKLSAPATMIFKEGKLLARKYGLMNEEQLKEMIKTEKAPEPKPDHTQELMNLFARKGEIHTINEDIGLELNAINNRIKELQKLLRG